jgi:glucose/arabinose dehydrogenase
MLRWLMLTLVLGLVACAGLSQVPPGSIDPTAAASPVSPPTETVLPTATVPPPPSPTPVQALPDASTAAWVPVVGGLDRPVDLKHAGDGRLFVVEKQGVIRIVRDGVLISEPFLDLRDRVGAGANEQGLLGLAFHPLFGENGRLFVNYTDTAGDTVVARYLASGNRADAASEVIILRIAQPFANHNGGSLAFGPDGYLYIGTGDGGSGGDPHGNGQSLNTLLGKILRLDVDGGEPYAVPTDNPYAASGEGAAEIWAFGLRNPWRIAFDRPTGDLYIGDVGQNRWEEIDVVPAGAPGGANFGWNVREGLHEYAGDSTSALVDPAAEYSHDFGCSVTGGLVVHDPALPAWDGTYLYGDYCSGRVWGLRRSAQGAWLNGPLFETGASISAFGEGADGQVYLLDYAGTIYRLAAAG